ncbi:MAG: hypothetical protein O2780_09270 [Proteobacteria bacterium]|nr:hypothetical protein [Pseudomonadota bacterium]
MDWLFITLSPVVLLAVVSCSSIGTGGALFLEGSIVDGVYVSPDNLFRVDVPEMRNPFIKQPSEIDDARTPGGGAEVNFRVPDLGEAWRYGARPSGLAPLAPDELAQFLDRELERWTPGNATVLSETQFETPGGLGIARVYLVEAASLLFVRQGEGEPRRESALIGVLAVASTQTSRTLYTVGQFDMPNRGSFYTIDTETGRGKLAAQHLTRMREMSTSLRIP